MKPWSIPVVVMQNLSKPSARGAKMRPRQRTRSKWGVHTKVSPFAYALMSRAGTFERKASVGGLRRWLDFGAFVGH